MAEEKDHYVYLIEDGTDLASDRKILINVSHFLRKYNFEISGKVITDPKKRYFL